MKNVRFSRNGVEFEPTKQELKIVLDDFAKQLGEKDKRIKVLDKALELACLELMQDLKFESKDDKHYTLCENIEYFKVMARKELGNE